MNGKSNLDRDGLDGIHGGSVRGEPAPAYRRDGNQPPPSAKIGFAILLLLAVVVGGVLYFLLVSDSRSPQTQPMAQAGTIPNPSAQAKVSLLTSKAGSGKQSTSARQADDATNVALETKKTANLELHKAQTLKPDEVKPLKTETQDALPRFEPHDEQAVILENQSPEMVGQQAPEEHPSDTESANAQPIGRKKGGESTQAALQGRTPMRAAEPVAAAMASPPLPAPVTVHFHWDSTDPFDWNATKLAAVRTLIQRCPEGVEIIGHTCNLGASDVNYTIGFGRAEVVRELLKQAGIPVKGVHLRSAGESQPVADNRTRRGRALNRRAVVACIEAKVSPE